MFLAAQYRTNAVTQNTDVSNTMEHLAADTAADCVAVANPVSANVALSNVNLTLQKRLIAWSAK